MKSNSLSGPWLRLALCVCAALFSGCDESTYSHSRQAESRTSSTVSTTSRNQTQTKYHAFALQATEIGGIPRLSLSMNGDVAFGTLHGNFRVLQVLDNSRALIDRIDGYGLSDAGILLDNYNTSNFVDGIDFSFSGSSLFQLNGTTRYETAIGSSRTVYSVSGLSRELFDQALNELEIAARTQLAEERARRQEAIDRARREVDTASSALADYRAANAEIAEYLSLTSRLELLKAAPPSRHVSRSIFEINQKLEGHAVPSEDQIHIYQTELGRLTSQLAKAADALSEAQAPSQD